MKRVIRVFPRRTKATPTDNLAAINRIPDLLDYADEVHVSVAFTRKKTRCGYLHCRYRSRFKCCEYCYNGKLLRTWDSRRKHCFRGWT